MDRPDCIAGAHDAVEQIGRDGAIGERRDRLARLRQIGISSAHRAPDRRCALRQPTARNLSAGTASTMKRMSEKPSPLNLAESPR